MCDVKEDGYDELMALHGRYSVKLGTIQSNMALDPLKIKESYLTDAPPSDMPTDIVKLYQPKLLHCQYNIHAM